MALPPSSLAYYRSHVYPPQIYGVHTATTLVPILGHILADGNMTLAAIYAPYFFVPLLLATKMATFSDPFPSKGTSVSNPKWTNDKKLH